MLPHGSEHAEPLLMQFDLSEAIQKMEQTDHAVVLVLRQSESTAPWLPLQDDEHVSVDAKVRPFPFLCVFWAFSLIFAHLCHVFDTVSGDDRQLRPRGTFREPLLPRSRGGGAGRRGSGALHRARGLESGGAAPLVEV